MTQRHHFRATAISGLYRIIGLYANQSADIADPVEPIEKAVVERQIQLAYAADAIIQLLFPEYIILYKHN